MNEFAKRIKDQRRYLELSLRKVCESVRNEKGDPISVSYLNDIEQEHRNPPDNKIIVQLARALKLDPEELLILAKKVHPDIEEAVGKEAKVGMLFRQILAHYEDDPQVLERIKAQLNQDKDKNNDAVG